MNKLGSVWAASVFVIASSSAAAQTTVESAQQASRDDVHASAGLTCRACHHENTSTFGIARNAVAPLCATCHSDAAYMKGFDPQIRVDQYAHT